MSSGEDRAVDGIGLADAIELIRDELLAARTSGEDADIRLPVKSVTVELRVVATKAGEGKAGLGFKVPFVSVELGASASRQWEHASTVTVVFDTPVDREGNPVKVAQASSQAKG